MAHESFEDEAVAAVMNERFVSIKVDREERPDVDSVYMQATVSMTGHGGWPMSVFLDHEGRPFYTGTYFPPQPRHQLPSFTQLLGAISETWQERRDDVLAAGARITSALATRTLPASGTGPPELMDLALAVASLTRDFDDRRGGFGGAPKFPPSMVLEFLLRHHALTEDERALGMAEETLEAMARGGIYDQLGGGFARYSVDADWVVPHFEKMLYDNALLLRVYLHWWRATGSPLAERVVRETAEFLLREMRTPEGGFAAALDADSEGREGAFYAWSPEQLVDVLGAEDGAWAAALLDVTAERDVRGRAVDAAAARGIPTMPRAGRHCGPGCSPHARRARVRAATTRWSPPGTGWPSPRWRRPARCWASRPGWRPPSPPPTSSWRCTSVPHGDDRLCRTSRDGRAGSNDAVLDDYGSVAEGFQVLFQVTGDDEWLVLAGILLDIAIQHFADGDGGFFDTADDAPALIQRPRDPSDNAEPSGWFAVANACITQAALTGVAEYRVVAERALSIATTLAPRAPRAAGWGLVAATALLAGPLEVARRDARRRRVRGDVAPGRAHGHLAGHGRGHRCRVGVGGAPAA